MKKLLITVAGISMLGMYAHAADRVSFYCSAQEDWCQNIADTYAKESGAEVSMVRRSSGESLAQVRAEARRPKGDLWWGGTGDPHLQAAEEDLTLAYESPNMAGLYPWAIGQYEASGGKTVGVYTNALGFGYNTELMEAKGLEKPQCWADLVKPEYKGLIQMANPNSSGTAYTMLATIVQLMGEDEGFEYMKQLHKNINQYTKSGSAGIKAAARGETTIGIVFLGDAAQQKLEGFPIEYVAPCEGTGYEVGSMSIIKGARNEEAAKKMYDWLLTVNGQNTAHNVNALQVMSNPNVEPVEGSPNMSEMKFIDYDFKKYGSEETRSKLLKRWDDEVSTLPR